MAIQAQGDVDDVMGEINVTPLVDVMLVLLVVFIVTAPLFANAVKVHLPQAATAPVEQKRSVTVSVDDAGRIYVDRAEVSLEEVEPELRRQRTLDPELTVRLNADETSRYGIVAKVMSAVDRAGVAKLSVLTLSP